MEHTFQISDEQYRRFTEYAKERGETPETLFRAWIEGTTDLMKTRRSLHSKRVNKEDEADVLDDPFFKLAGAISVEDINPNWISRHDEHISGDVFK
jgi:hypothetical protein